MKGSLLNATTVAVGAGLGLIAGRGVPAEYLDTALRGLGLVTVTVAIGMALKGRNPLITAAAVAGGGLLGLALGIGHGLESLGAWLKSSLGGGGRFAEGFVASFVLFCVGPMTVLGCLEDGLEGKTDLLRLKSTMDGVAAFFLAAATGAGVLATAAALLVFQGGLTLAARPLAPMAKDEDAMAALSGVGGAILLGTGLGLLGLTRWTTADFLPAILIGPVLANLARRRVSRKT